MSFFLALFKEKGGIRRERPALRQAKIPPVEGFLVPRAGGGTAPVPPVSPITRSRKNKPSPDGLFFLRALCPFPPPPPDDIIAMYDELPKQRLKNK